MQHATLSASGSHRWINCPGSIRLTADLPRKPGSIFAQEGTAAHSLAEACLSAKDGIKDADSFISDIFEGHIVDYEMADAVQVYLDEIKTTIKANPGSTIQVEKHFDLSWLHPGMFGTNDCSLHSPIYNLLYIFDYKHGKGVPVEVKNNSQLMYYALGAYHNLKELGLSVDKVIMTIVQPRASHKDGPIRSWEISIDELKAWSKELKNAALETEKPNAKLKAGDWCRWCDAQGMCTAIHDKALATAQAEFSDKTVKLPEPEKLTDEQLIKLLVHTPMIESWLKAVQSFAHNELERGRKIEGFKLVTKKTNRRWINEEDVKKKFKNRKDVLTDPKLKSPAQLEKIKDIGKEGIEGLWEKPQGASTIAPEHDKRPAVIPSIETSFKHVIADDDPLLN